MPDGHAILLFMAATLALNLTPGPDMLLVISRSVDSGTRAGAAAALGVAVGCFVHMSLVAGGLAAFLIAVPAAAKAIRIAGAVYLVLLGIRLLMNPPGLSPDLKTAPRAAGTAFRQGVITNVLNPKVALFFLAFLPQFVSPRGASPALQVLLLGVFFNLSGTTVNLLVALAAGRATAWLRRSANGPRRLQRATGALFVGLGLRVALAVRRE